MCKKNNKLCQKNNLGKFLKSFLLWNNLKNWHKYEIMNKLCGKKKIGGGIILSAIHEFDLMYALFGNAKFIQSYNDHLRS